MANEKEAKALAETELEVCRCSTSKTPLQSLAAPSAINDPVEPIAIAHNAIKPLLNHGNLWISPVSEVVLSSCSVPSSPEERKEKARAPKMLIETKLVCELKYEELTPPIKAAVKAPILQYPCREARNF